MSLPVRILILLLFLPLPAARAADISALVLDEMNFARTRPAEYAAVVARHARAGGRAGDAKAVAEAVRFLKNARPLAPMKSVPGLAAAARLHVNDQGITGGVGHVGRDRSRPWHRISRFGKYSGQSGENIFYGSAGARDIVVRWIVDAGVWGRGHRKNIFNPAFRVAGVAAGAHPRFGRMCVADFAGGFTGAGAGGRL